MAVSPRSLFSTTSDADAYEALFDGGGPGGGESVAARFALRGGSRATRSRFAHAGCRNFGRPRQRDPFGKAQASTSVQAHA